jgi:Mrp family chromosome partitioning ATPase
MARCLRRSLSGRVLVVDASPAGRSVTETLGVGAGNSVGDGTTGSPADCIRTYPEVGLDLLTINGALSEWLDYDGDWQSSIREISQGYRLTVVDAGNLRSRAPYAWSLLAEKTVLVIDTTQSTVEKLQRLRRDLEGTSIKLSGFVLNKRRYPVPGYLYRYMQ